MSSSDPSSSETEEDGELLRRRYNDLRADCEKLEARVVALAQREYQITDDKITKAFHRIRDGLDIWIDGLQEDDRKDFKANYQANIKARDRLGIFAKLGFKDGCLELRWEEKLGDQETCIYVILGMVITNFLKRLHVERPYPLGLKEYQEIFLDTLMKSASATKGMAAPKHNTNSTKLKTIDQATLYRWRGETLSMIAGAAEYTRRCKEDSEVIFEELRKDMTVWLSSKLLSEHKTSLRDLILQPVVEFHRMIHCSGKKFELHWHFESRSSIPDGDILDISTWRKTRHDHIKGVFHCLLPALVMKDAIDQANITFTKAVFLGYMASSLDPTRSARSSPVRQDSASTHRGPAVPRNPPAHHAPQPRPSRSKDQKSESAPTKDNRSEPGLFRKLWPGSRSENRSEGGPARRGSHPTVPPAPSTRASKHDTTHRHEPGHARSQNSGSDQASRSESQTPTSISISTVTALDLVNERSEINSDVDEDRKSGYANGSETGWAVSSTSTENTRLSHYIPEEEVARLAGRRPVDAEHREETRAD